MSMAGINVVGVQFRRAGKIYDFAAADLELNVGDLVIVDSERGPSLAEVVTVRFHHPQDKLEKKLKSIVRVATPRELKKPARLTAAEVMDFTVEQVTKHKLKMKVLQSEIQFGGSKVIVYFTAPGRVDFRDLVKDLAGGLKTRIELKQIGARDETKLLGGLGICGREYCCSSFLREFVPVSIKMAKNQNLALNPSKVSGGCGRLLCCLTYENSTYSKLRQSLPPRGTRVKIIDGDQVGVVTKSDLLNQVVSVETPEGSELIVKVDRIEILDASERRFAAASEDGEDSEASQWAEDLDLDALEAELSGLEDSDTSAPRQDRTARQKARSGRENRGQREDRPHAASQQGRERNPAARRPHQPSHPGAKNPRAEKNVADQEGRAKLGERGKDKRPQSRPRREGEHKDPRPKKGV